MRNAKDIDLTETAATEADGPATDSPTRPPTTGEVAASRYALGDEVGRGGIGRVLSARDNNLDRDIAVKELLKPTVTAEARFLREAKITARLQHPGIVPIYETGRWPNGDPFYAMKLVSGKSLKELINEAGNLEERLALIPNVLAVADAVAYAHSKRVVHRDLKPSNIVVGEFGETVVIDWGLARDLSKSRPCELSEGPFRAPRDPKLTSTGSVLGTPHYMAPEQARGEAVDERSDIYSLGAVLFHVVAGHSPFRDTDSADVVADLAAGKGALLDSVDLAVPAGLGAIIEKAMDRESSNRYQSASEFADEIRRYQANQRVHAYSYRWREGISLLYRRNRAVVAVVTAAAAVLSTFAIASVLRVLGERDRANEAVESLEDEKGRVSAALAAAERERNQLVLVQAQSAVETDPTTALAWALEYRGVNRRALQNVVATAHAHGVAGHVLKGHRLTIGKVKLSSDGSSLISHSYDGSIIFWNLRSRRSRPLAADAAEGTTVAIAVDGSRVAYVNQKNRLVVVRVDDASQQDLGPAPLVKHVGYTESGDVITAGADGSVRRWGEGQALFESESPIWVGAVSETGTVVVCADGVLVRLQPDPIPSNARCDSLVYISNDGSRALAATSKSIQLFRNGSWQRISLPIVPWEVTLSGDGSLLAAISKTGVLLVRRADEPEDNAWRASIGSEATVLDFSDDNRYLAVGDTDGTVSVFDSSGSRVAALKGHKGAVQSLDFSHSGQLASGADDGVRVWSLAALEHEVMYRGAQALFNLAVSPGGHHVAVDGREGIVRVVDLSSGLLQELPGHRELVFGITWLSPQRLLSASWDGLVGIWDAESGTGVRKAATAGKLRSVVTVGRGKFATGGADGKVRLWGPNYEYKVLGSLPAEVHRLAASEVTKQVAAVGSEGSVAVWVAQTGRLLRRVTTHTGQVNSVDFSPDGEKLVTAGADGRVVLSTAERTRELLQLGVSAEVARYSPDGRHLVVGTLEGDVLIFETDTNKILEELNTRAGRIRNVAFSADSRLVAFGSADGTVRALDFRDGRLFAMVGHSGRVGDVDFAGSGDLLSASFDGSLRRWRLVGGIPLEIDALNARVADLTSARVDPSGTLRTIPNQSTQ